MVLTLALYTTTVLVVLGAGLYGVGVYNQVVSFARDADRSFANIDVALRQRHDEIPRLVETCRAYMVHEKSVLEEIASIRTRTRAATDIDGKVVAENDLTALVSKIFVLAENYPELKANELFLNLQRRMSDVEKEIADRRELFNASVTGYNTIIESFPVLLLSIVFRWRARATLDLGMSE